jgi:hypothetical protein
MFSFEESYVDDCEQVTLTIEAEGLTIVDYGASVSWEQPPSLVTVSWSGPWLKEGNATHVSWEHPFDAGFGAWSSTTWSVTWSVVRATQTPAPTASRSPLATPSKSPEASKSATSPFTASNVHADTDGVLVSLAPVTADMIASNEVFDQTREFNSSQDIQASLAFTPVGTALTGAAIGVVVAGVVGAALVAAAVIVYFIFRKRPALSEGGAPETTANRDDDADLRGGSVTL